MEISSACADWSAFENNLEAQLNSGDVNLQKIDNEAKKRFKCIFELKPIEIYRGLKPFQIIMLLFEETDKVILESVVYGNAIYVIEGDWRVLSRKTKSELKKQKNTKVIPTQEIGSPS